MLCWGFPWKIPQAALDVPRLALRELSPGPAAAAPRPDPARLGPPGRRRRLGLHVALHGRRARHGQHARAGDGADRGRRRRHRRSSRAKLQANAVSLLPRALERVAAGDPGDVQPTEGASWAGHFEDDDYVHVDWSASARSIHNQVRAWHLTFGMSGLRAPVADVDGEMRARTAAR